MLSCSNYEDRVSDSIAKQENISKINSNSGAFARYSSSDIGAMHNNSLYALMEDIENNESDYTQANQPSSVAFEFYKNYVFSNTETEWSNEQISAFLDDFKTFSYVNDTDFIRLTNTQYYQDLLTIIDSDGTIENVQNDIDSLLNDLNNDNEINENDKIALKSAMLVGKSSYEFWNTDVERWQSIRAKFVSNTNAASKIKVKNKYLKADIEGAIGGAITGAITGPQGAAIGAMLGAPWASGISGFFNQYIWD